MSSRSSKRFLAPEVLEEAVSQLADLVDEQDVSAALVGGYALQLYGSPRLTGDVDVAVEASIESLPPGQALSFGGMQTEAPNGVPVDMIVRDDDYAQLYADAIEHAQRLPDVPVYVARPEYLFAMKMVAGRPRDRADLDWLVTFGAVDLARARTVVRRHLGPYAVQEMDRIVEEARWRAARGGRAE